MILSESLPSSPAPIREGHWYNWRAWHPVPAQTGWIWAWPWHRVAVQWRVDMLHLSEIILDEWVPEMLVTYRRKPEARATSHIFGLNHK